MSRKKFFSKFHVQKRRFLSKLKRISNFFMPILQYAQKMGLIFQNVLSCCTKKFCELFKVKNTVFCAILFIFKTLILPNPYC